MKIIKHFIEQPPKEVTDLIICCDTMREAISSTRDDFNVFVLSEVHLYINTNYMDSKTYNLLGINLLSAIRTPIRYCPWCGEKIEAFE